MTSHNIKTYICAVLIGLCGALGFFVLRPAPSRTFVPTADWLQAHHFENKEAYQDTADLIALSSHAKHHSIDLSDSDFDKVASIVRANRDYRSIVTSMALFSNLTKHDQEAKAVKIIRPYLSNPDSSSIARLMLDHFYWRGGKDLIFDLSRDPDPKIAALAQGLILSESKIEPHVARGVPSALGSPEAPVKG